MMNGACPPQQLTQQASHHNHHHHHRHNGYNIASTRSNGTTVPSSSTNGVSPYYNGVEPMDVKPVRPAFQVENELEAVLAKVGSSSNGNIAPPLQTTGKYCCPRCERKFDNKKMFSDHKTRCIV